MLISHSHRFIFFHVAKVAGMSLRDPLTPLCEEPERFRIARPPRTRGGAPNPFYGVWETLLWHASARDARRYLPAEVFEPYFKFGFVRNPWDWHVSMYHFILARSDHPRRALVQAMPSFEAYLEWVRETPRPFTRGATKQQVEMLTDEDGALLVDFVGRYERLAEDFNAVCGRLGVQARLPHRNRSPHKPYRALYSPRARALVEEISAEDIALFGYRFEEGCASELQDGEALLDEQHGLTGQEHPVGAAEGPGAGR
ncbi:MAG: sulfotransferase family 2 domain-containing protein [Alphaproteobacteria bacterium]|nr:sulfotransferase family 2 domain-containing protein [Alphaproteobacteria bacterium]